MYLGDYKEDDTVYFLWSSNDKNGASTTRATDGTVQVYKDNGTTQTTTGVTDTEDFDGLTGIHACTIDLSSDGFYATGADYAVVLSGATIDGESVNAVLAHFSIENRHNEVTLADNAITAAKIATDAIDAGAIAANAIGASEVADNAIDGGALATSALDAIADAICDEALSGHVGAGTVGGQLGSLPDAAAIGVQVRDDVLKRGVANVEDTADVDSLAALLLKELHAAVVNDSLVIYKTDDSTTFDTKAITKSATALPITSVKDP